MTGSRRILTIRWKAVCGFGLEGAPLGRGARNVFTSLTHDEYRGAPLQLAKAYSTMYEQNETSTLVSSGLKIIPK